MPVFIAAHLSHGGGKGYVSVKPLDEGEPFKAKGASKGDTLEVSCGGVGGATHGQHHLIGCTLQWSSQPTRRAPGPSVYALGAS